MKAHDRAAIEKALGMPWLDFMFDAYVQTGSVRIAARMLVERSGGYLASPQAVAHWWTAAGKADPSIWTAALTARGEQVCIDDAVAEGLAAEERGGRAEIELVRAALNGHHCQVCGAPAPVDRVTTCEPRCAELWQAHRYHISEEARASLLCTIARWTAAHADSVPASQVVYAERVLSGRRGSEHGRWVTSDDVWIALTEVQARRKAAKERWGGMAADLPPIAAMA